MNKLLIIVGLIFLGSGLLLTLFPGALSWFGRLPGDIRIEGENTRFYFPIISMLVVSVVITILINLFNRL